MLKLATRRTSCDFGSVPLGYSQYHIQPLPRIYPRSCFPDFCHQCSFWRKSIKSQTLSKVVEEPVLSPVEVICIFAVVSGPRIYFSSISSTKSHVKTQNHLTPSKQTI